MSKRSRIAIIGAGLSGLSLAHRLDGQHEIHLFDPQRQNGKDRSYGYFRVHPHPFEDAVSQRYQRISVYSNTRSVTCQPAARYERIDGAGLFERLWSGISGPLNSPLQMDIDDFDLCFDSSSRADAPEYWQVFAGGEYQLRGELDLDTAVLMDFRVRARQNEFLRFVYVLPLSKGRALVQVTYIVTPAQRASLNLEQSFLADLQAHMQHYFHIDLDECVRTEHGAIPLYLQPERSSACVNIGARAGWVRASTGYSFLETQRGVDAIVAAMSAGRLRSVRTRPAHLDRMDAVFLKAITRRADIAGEWFAAMFANADTNALVSFLAGTAGLGASARVAASILRSGYARDFLRETVSG